MLKLTLDGQNVDTGSLRGRSLADLIQVVEKKLSPERVIISLTLDGRLLDRQAEQEKARAALEDLERLDIRTQRVDELARGTVLNVIEFIPSLAASVSACVESLQGADEQAGITYLRRVIDGLQIVASAWPVIAKALVAEGFSAGNLLPRLDGFNDMLNRIAAVQEARDQVQLCDLLEAELSEYLEDWFEHAKKLGRLLEQKN